jgi:hypothetical protein
MNCLTRTGSQPYGTRGSSDMKFSIPTSALILSQDGTRIYGDATGNPQNPAVVFVHGFGSSSHTFDGLFADSRLTDSLYLVRSLSIPYDYEALTTRLCRFDTTSVVSVARISQRTPRPTMVRAIPKTSSPSRNTLGSKTPSTPVGALVVRCLFSSLFALTDSCCRSNLPRRVCIHPRLLQHHLQRPHLPRLHSGLRLPEGRQAFK